MSITIELTSQEIAAIKQLTRLEDNSKAVSQAVREFLRLSRLRELKMVAGQVEFEDHSQELEALELDEAEFPR